MEQKIPCVSASGPQMQHGTPPRAGRKMAAVLIHPNHLLLQYLNQAQIVQILGKYRETTSGFGLWIFRAGGGSGPDLDCGFSGPAEVRGRIWIVDFPGRRSNGYRDHFHCTQ